MKKIKCMQWIFLTLCILGIIIFWSAGFNNRIDIAEISLIIAGICAWLALCCAGLIELRKEDFYY